MFMQGVCGFLILIFIEVGYTRSFGYVMQKAFTKCQRPAAIGNVVTPSEYGAVSDYNTPKMKMKLNRKGSYAVNGVARNGNITNPDLDVDVIEEGQQAAKVSCVDVPVVARDLTKYYGSFLAVNKVNFLVRAGECFGLLGVNGAGKTTTFQMLTGENSLTGGDAFISGTSIKRNWRQVWNKNFV